jgi:hypothetical protein
MYTPRSLHAAPDPTDPDVLYDLLPPIQPPTVWRRAFPTITQIATSIRHRDNHAAAA